MHPATFSFWFAYIDANEAVKLDKTLSWAWYRRGVTLARLGFYSESRKSLNKCLELSPNEKAAKKELDLLKKKRVRLYD